MKKYFILLPVLLFAVLLTNGCEKPKQVAKPIDSTKVFTYDSLFANPGQPGGTSIIKKVNLRGDLIDTWKKSWNENGELISSIMHNNLAGQQVYSVDSVFNGSNMLTELTRSIDSLSEYQHFFFNGNGDTIKTLIGIHTQKYFVIFQRTHTSPTAYSALLDGNPNSKINVKETDFFNAQRSFNMKCDMVGMNKPEK
jgi:hypothetical protein